MNPNPTVANPAAAGPAVARSVRRYRRPSTLAVVLICTLAGAIRILYITSPKVGFNADEASVGLMIRDIGHGRNYVFFAGQSYGGTLEQYLQAAMYATLRLPENPVTLRLPLVGLNVATCWLIYLCGRRMLPSPGQATVAALLYAIGPWYNIVGGTMDLGFYAVSQLLGSAGLYCGLRFSRTDSWGWAAGFGLCCGLAVWNSLTSAYLLLPTAIWLLPRLIRSVRAILLMLCAAMVGLLPVICWVAQHHTLPSPGPRNIPSSIGKRIQVLARYVLPEHLGFTGSSRKPAPSPWHELWYPVIALLLLGFAVAVLRRRRALLALVRLRLSPRAELDIALLAVPIIALLYCSQRAAWYSQAPRYLFASYPITVIAVVALLPRVSKARMIGSAGLLLTVVIGSTGAVLQSMPNSGLGNGANKMYADAVQYLVGHHETTAYSGYWTAMPLDYYSRGRITAVVVLGSVRFPSKQAKASTSMNIAYVLDHREGFDISIRDSLVAAGIHFRTTHIGDLNVLDHLDPVPAAGTIGLRPR